MLSQAVGYAATALGYVAAAGGSPILVKEIAEASGIPGSYLAKIINVLARKAIVVTQRGIGGGVVLARPAKDVTLFDLCIALDDASVQLRCMLGTSECSDARACPAHQFWCAQRDDYLAFLKGTTIADIAAFETRRRWKGQGAGDRPLEAAAGRMNGFPRDNSAVPVEAMSPRGAGDERAR